MRTAIIGCGYVADFYIITLGNYPQLELAGLFDRNEERATVCSRKYGIYQYRSLDELLADASISIVINLTDIHNHYNTTKRCLEAGKHVYSEKPFALNLQEAEELLELARKKSLQIACAPASLLGEAGQTIWKFLREGAIGKVWLAYAELDDGTIHQMNYQRWQSESGVAWPFQSEFEMGCTIEHAGYHLSWLTAFFGPAKNIQAFSTCLVPEKMAGDISVALGDDLSVSCITFSSNVVARLTCSTLAPKNHSLTIIGSEGVLTVEDCWQFESPVYIQKRLKDNRHFSDHTYLAERQRVTLERSVRERIRYKNTHEMDFACGVAELSDSIQQKRVCRLSAQHALHVLEILMCIKNRHSSIYEMKTSFPQINPMLWAE